MYLWHQDGKEFFAFLQVFKGLVSPCSMFYEKCMVRRTCILILDLRGQCGLFLVSLWEAQYQVSIETYI